MQHQVEERGVTVEATLEILRAGVRRFRTDVYPAAAELYRRAANEPQRPHTLFITCADSRVDPELITQSGPGEMFVARNVGNMVPAYGEMLGGVSAVIEYAVLALKVGHIAVCGHSECGAMKALLDPESAAAMPAVANWLGNAAAALTAGDELPLKGGVMGQRMRQLTERNVLLQLHHLRTHPSVAIALREGTLTLSGWVYEIATGEVRISDGGTLFHEVQARAEVLGPGHAR